MAIASGRGSSGSLPQPKAESASAAAQQALARLPPLRVPGFPAAGLRRRPPDGDPPNRIRMSLVSLVNDLAGARSPARVAHGEGYPPPDFSMRVKT